MKVVVDGQSSKEVTVDSGVPQGTVLGPICFLLHINDLPSVVNSQVRLFADDCLLYRPIKSEQDHLILQKDLEALERWAEDWGMSFNAKKCYVLSIKQKTFRFYSLCGHILQEVDSNPYLGVTISNDLKWSNHINNISKKASSSLGFIRRNLRFCPQDCRKMAYLALVRSTLEYSAVAWDPHLQGDIDRLEGIQRRAARFILHDYTSRQPGDVTKMLKTLNLPTLQERRQQQRLCFFYKVVRGLVPGIHPDSYLNKIRESRRIRPVQHPDFNSSNIVVNHARNNQECYRTEQGKTLIHKNSFFPRTVINWNNLEDNTISAPSVESFRGRLNRAN